MWLRKPWGEWLTVSITSSLVPVEIYEIYRHPSWVKAGVFVINVAIVGYLIYRIRSRRAGSE
ncbi:Putative membrane protein (fragment) [Acidobacteriia bacterium SbA2]